MKAGAGALTPEMPVSTAKRASPVISAIVCTYNRHELLAGLLRSLQAQTLDSALYEIIVIDNSTDITAQTDFWRDTPGQSNLRLIKEPVPGLSRARNIGMRASQAPILAYIDDDAIAVPEWLEILVETFHRDSAIGIAGGPVEPIWPSSAPPWLHEWLRGFLTILDLGSTPRQLQEGEWLAGTNIAFRKSTLERAGGFNETLGRIKGTLLSNEELAISTVVHDQGFMSYYAPAARVFHRVHADRISQAWMRRRVSWQVVSDLLAGDSMTAARGRLWSELGNYLLQLPPEYRNIRGLFYDTPDAALFQQQCTAISALIRLLMDDGADPDPTPAP